jgi:hypothetical protein
MDRDQLLHLELPHLAVADDEERAILVVMVPSEQRERNMPVTVWINYCTWSPLTILTRTLSRSTTALGAHSLTLCAHGAGLLHPPRVFGKSGAHGPDKDELMWIVDPACGALDRLASICRAWNVDRFVLPSPFIDAALPCDVPGVQFFPPSGAPSPVPM